MCYHYHICLNELVKVSPEKMYYLCVIVKVFLPRFFFAIAVGFARVFFFLLIFNLFLFKSNNNIINLVLLYLFKRVSQNFDRKNVLFVSFSSLICFRHCCRFFFLDVFSLLLSVSRAFSFFTNI